MPHPGTIPKKKIPVLHFPINVSWKCHIQHLTIHQWLNHEYFQYLYNSKSTFNIIYFAITHSYHIWKLLKKIKLAMCVFGQQSDSSLISCINCETMVNPWLKTITFLSANFNIAVAISHNFLHTTLGLAFLQN